MLTPEEKAAVARAQAAITCATRMTNPSDARRTVLRTTDADLLLSALSRFTSPEWEAMALSAKEWWMQPYKGGNAKDADDACKRRERDTLNAAEALGRRLANAEGEG